MTLGYMVVFLVSHCRLLVMLSEDAREQYTFSFSKHRAKSDIKAQGIRNCPLLSKPHVCLFNRFKRELGEEQIIGVYESS